MVLRSLQVVIIAATAGIAALSASAAPVDHVRLSRTGSVSTVEIELGCAMRYLDHSPAESGIEFRVQLELGQDCINALRNTPSARYRPPGARLANLETVDFDTTGRSEGAITLRFERPVRLRLHQTANQYLLTLLIQEASGAEPSTPPPRAQVTRPAPDAPATPVGDPARHVQRTPSGELEKFAIRLQEFESSEHVDEAALQRIRSHVVYTNEVALSGRQWIELRMGFFDTEEEALAALSGVQTIYPDAWITIASPAEQAIARQRQMQQQDVAAIEAKPEPEAARSNPAAPRLDDAIVAELMTDAKSAIVTADYDKSIRIYTKVLAESDGPHRREAREFLGVVREKNGQLAHARAEYKAYLDEFPPGPETDRVSQRLAALAAAPAAAVQVPRTTRDTQPETAWQIEGGISQFYLHGVDLARDDEDRVAESAVLSQADFYVTRRGERFDLIGRGNVSYLYEFADNGRDNQGRVSYAYLDIADNRSTTTARIGRQTQHRGGILGRFDGAQVSYSPWTDITLKFNAGLPVDTPRYVSSPDHYFYGGSVEFNDFASVLDVSVFANMQTIDGIADRQAVGGDAQFHRGGLNVIGLIDYDASYNVLNNAMITGSWRFNDRITVSGRYQGGAAPYLTTRNAIIGQPFNTIDSLKEIYTEGQIRRLARNRTAEFRSGSATISAELSERWNINASMYYNEYGATVASGGVAAFPATGPIYDWNLHFLGASILKTADSVNLGYRRHESRRDDSNTVFADIRFPIGSGLRINPRLSVTRQQRFRTGLGEAEQWVVDPMLRIVYRWRQRYRVEFEMGGRWSDEELPPDPLLPPSQAESIETSAYYLHLGYWMDFGR